MNTLNLKSAFVYGSFFTLSVSASLATQCIAEADSAQSRYYVAKQLPEDTTDLRSLKIERAQQFHLDNGRILVTGSSVELNTKTDIGLRLFLVEKLNNSLRIAYKSKGSGDSYILSPYFFRSPADNSWIVLAEMGAEYSWGIRVFLMHGSTAVDIGTLNVGVIKQRGVVGNIESAIPFTVIERKEDSTIFSFTSDVVLDPGGRNQRTVRKEDIKYVYSNGTLREQLK